MHKKFIRMTSGWIPVSVMALLTVALIAGHARANLPKEVVAAQISLATTSLGAALNAELLRQLESLPASVNTLLIVPDNVRRRFDTRILRKELSSDQAIRRIRQ
tara:strand:+ start:642 stop:953 length:312 start_codon:yes stop_codon:yes gene_type:complete